MRRTTTVIILLGSGMLLGWCAGILTRERGASAPRAVTPRAPLLSAEQTLIERFGTARTSVAFITSIAYQRDWLSFDLQAVPQGSGSGIVWDERGHIVTNFHVIEGANELEVTLFDHSTARAEVVGVAPDKDLAVIRLLSLPPRLTPIPIGTSADLKVGQSVMAIGNPFGLDQTLTTGIVSALGREIQSATRRRISGVIQTDAAINPGNSGGPLLDSAGRLIGVNTALQSPSGASAGIGFAVPVDTVNRVVPQLISRGSVARADLGLHTLSESYARAFNAPKGVVVAQVEPGSSAARAGLQGIRRRGRQWELGDVIMKVNGRSVETPDQLLDAIEAEPIGTTVELEILRGGKKLRLPLFLKRGA
jgi:S1-C subfamily serine protease